MATTAVKHEPVCFLDQSGSEDEVLAAGSSTKRWTFQLQAAQSFITLLKEADDAAADAAAADEDEEEGGGTLTYAFSSPGRAVKLGDLNPANFATKTAHLHPGGYTYIMPAVALWQQDRDEEFTKDEQNDVMRQFDILVATDGALNDEEQFIAWIGRSEPNIRVYFAIVGDGPDNQTAVADYQQLASQSAGKVTVYDMRHVTDPSIFAKQMVQAILS